MGAAAVAQGQTQGQTIDPLKIPDTQLEPIKWSSLDGWAADNHEAALAAFRVSCAPFNRQQQLSDTRPVAGALKQVCRRLARAGTLKGDKARAFFEENFQPVRIAKLGESTGLITGYYEPIVDGSRLPNREFHTPLYRRPRDLVIKGQRRPIVSSIPNRAEVGRLNTKKQFEPYYDRLAIEDGALDGQKLEICYVADPFEAMSMQIQGSVRVRLEDGTLLRLNYDAHNGHNYTAVGRVLIERNLVPREEMSMDRIKRWMQANPDKAKEVRGTNKSFVFFRITGLNNEDEPVGAQGVRLTPGRSIAVDRTHVYGTPFFIEAELPIESARSATRFRRLMVSQDTGSAIIGPARADFYWGAGDEAGKVAGRLRNAGRFVMLLPRELDMVEAGKKMPLPPPKPVISDAVAAKTPGAKTPDAKAPDAKTPGAKTDAKAPGAKAQTTGAKTTNAKSTGAKTTGLKANAGKAGVEQGKPVNAKQAPPKARSQVQGGKPKPGS
jgi:membrane-bound lytic murein transglycosylase A